MSTDLNSNAIAWIEGQWNSPHQLQLPLSDRGLQLADGLFETVLIRNGAPQLLGAHLERWRSGASIMAMAMPPSEDILKPLIQEAICRIGIQKGYSALRLNWSRGELQGRGINLPKAAPNPGQHRFWMTLQAHKPSFSPLNVCISRYERRNPYTRLSLCKSFSYSQAIQARREAQVSNFDEAILLSTSGELCCATTANLIVRRGSHLFTPRLRSGCLPGIMRQQCLKKGILQESKLSPTPEKNDEWLIINSLGCQPIMKIDNHLLKVWPNPQDFWQSLLI